tara:strand:- start:103 stop:1113 length:1011 start_codon:yes stop_codon:yes gene_type:complete
MKILYVEDELSKQIDTILSIFNQILGDGLKKELRALMDDESGRGASPEQIKEIIEKSNRLDVCDSFPEALRIVTNFSDDYDLFIVDRNLSAVDYLPEDVQKINASFSDELWDKYFEREGDWLLNVLSDIIDTRKQFYFLTAYTDDDIIIEKNSSLSEQGRFHRDQVIKKGELDQLDFLKKKIKKHPSIMIRHKNQDIIDILQNEFGDDAVNEFIEIINRGPSLFGTANEIRIFFENRILRGIAHKKKLDLSPICFNEKGGINISGFVFFLRSAEYVDNTFVKNDWKFGCDTVIFSEISSIKDICQKGSHEKIITTDTVNHLISGLKDIIRWYGTIK